MTYTESQSSIGKTGNNNNNSLSNLVMESHPPVSEEELLYYRIFQRHFPHPDAANLIGKWQGTLH